ncbi:MAG: Zn-ribbon domain-containing OB-fold protein [Actinomycetota bacterium]
MPDWKEDVEEIVHEGKIAVPYTWTVGSNLSKFYCELRDNGKIWANRCPSCEAVFVPPKAKCIYCYKNLNDWVELPGTGTLESYTVVRYEEPVVHPRKAPFIYGVVKMDGADTGLVHFIDEVDLDDLKVGMRVEAVMEEEREGNILDIKHFRPIA